MCLANNINNIVLLNHAISHQNETISTNDNIDHCSFVFRNKTKLEGIHKIKAFSLDYLLDKHKIENIGYLHIDIEGMEYPALLGSTKLINKYKPIITFEQHIMLDNVESILSFLINKGYKIFYVDERRRKEERL